MHAPLVQPRRRRRSPSQITTWITCHRLWGFVYLWGLREEQTPQQHFGVAGHKVIELWMLYGTPPDISTKVGNAAAAIIKRLPAPSPHIEVERPMEFRHDVVVYHGIPDIRYWSEHGRTIFDHKFTSSVVWAMSEDDLRMDVQANVYAKREFVAFPHIDHVDLHWNYVERHSARIQPVSVRLHKHENEVHFEPIHEITLEIERAEQTCTNPLDLPPNFSSCHKYNRPCPHQQRCGLSAETMLVAIMTQEEHKIDIRERMAQRRAGMTETGGGAAPPPGNPQPPPAVAAQAAPQGFVAQPTTQYPGWAWNGQTWVPDATTAPPGSTWDGQQWVVPPQPAPAPALAVAPAPVVTTPPQAAQPLTEAPAQPQTVASTAPSMNPPESAEPGDPPEPRRRGRPKGANGKSVSKVDALLDERFVRLVFHASALMGGRTPAEAEAAFEHYSKAE